MTLPPQNDTATANHATATIPPTICYCSKRCGQQPGHRQPRNYRRAFSPTPTERSGMCVKGEKRLYHNEPRGIRVVSTQTGRAGHHHCHGRRPDTVRADGGGENGSRCRQNAGPSTLARAHAHLHTPARTRTQTYANTRARTYARAHAHTHTFHAPTRARARPRAHPRTHEPTR